MSEPTEAKFAVGQKVIRVNENLGAVVLEVVATGQGTSFGDLDNYTYHIKYDEGMTSGNDGTGWWPESSLAAAADS
jgi:hypothetical protein